MDVQLPFHHSYRKMEEEKNPFNRIHRLLDTFEAFSRFLTIICIRDFLRSRSAEDDESQRIGSFLTHRLYAPTLGTWHEFLYRSARYLASRGSTFSRDVYTLLGYRRKADALLDYPLNYRGRDYVLKNIQEAFGLFTVMRNDYAHGATPPDHTCEEDYRGFRPLLDTLLDRARFLQDYTLEIAGVNGDRQPVIRRGDGCSLPLYPFMLHSGGEYYFFNDARMKHKEKLTFLSYRSALKIVDTESFRFLKNLFPQFDICQEEINPRKKQLLDTVIGRDRDAASMEEMVLTSTRSRVFYIFGDPGIGKSAMAAYLDEYYFTRCVKAFHMFLHNEADTLQADSLFRSIARPLVSAGLIPPMEITTSNPAEVKRQVSYMLRQASATAAVKKKKIILIIDGLDEAFHAAEPLYNLLPQLPPPHVRIIYFSRRREEIYSGIYRGSDSRAVTRELTPLKKEAIRAILWQAVSKYTINAETVDRVYTVSQGNPLYLRYLVNAALEDPAHLRGDAPLGEAPLPGDIIEYYHRLILQAVERAPRLPVIDIAMVFSACPEALHPEQIKTILKDISIENILLGIKALSEIIRPVVLKGNVKKYRLFHLSIAEYLENQYTETARKIQDAVLFSVLPPRRRESLEKWFDQFTRSRRRSGGLRLQAEKNLSIFLQSTDTFPSAYKLLVRKIANHANAAAIIRRCCDIATARQDQRIFHLVDDCLLKMHERSAGSYTRLISHLVRRFPGDENLKRHIIDALVLLRLSGEHYNRVIDLLMGYLLDYPLTMLKSKQFSHLKTIAAVSGFARSPDTFVHLGNILAIILNIRRSRTIPAEKSDETEQLITRLAGIVFSPAFNRLVSRYREKDNARLITRGDESYPRLLFKGGGTLLEMPRGWFDLARVLRRWFFPVARKGAHLSLDMGKRLRIAAEIMQRAFPLIFTSAQDPDANPLGRLAIAELEKLFKARLQAIPLDESNVYQRLREEMGKEERVFAHNIGYLFSVIGLPLSVMLRRDYRTGRETLPDLEENEREEIRLRLRLLKAEEPISAQDEEVLFQYLSNPDAWENYFAVAVIIVHGNTQLDIWKRISMRLLEDMPGPAGSPDSAESSVNRRLRIYRQFFTLHTYLLRRAKEPGQVEAIGANLLKGLDRVYLELSGKPLLLEGFIHANLYNQGAPFNPLLPVAILDVRQGRAGDGESRLDTALETFLELASRRGSEIKKNMAHQLLGDLLSFSLFHPGPALRAALRYYRKWQKHDPEQAELAIEKIYLMDLLMPGYLDTSINENTEGYEAIRKKLPECKESVSGDIGMVENIHHEMRLLAWNEFISRLMVAYPAIRDMVLWVVEESFKAPVSLPLLLQRMVTGFLEAYFSPVIHETFENFFTLDTPITRPARKT